MAIHANLCLYIGVYGYILPYMRLYMAIYGNTHPKIRILGVWTCILGVWTCILGVWTCILSVWTCIFVSGFVFLCLDLYFGCLDLYSGYCILVGCLYTCRVSVYLWGVCIVVGCDCGVRAPTTRGDTAWSMCLPQAPFFLKKTRPMILEHVSLFWVS